MDTHVKSIKGTLKSSSVQNSTPVSLVKAYSIFKTSQEHAVPHFIKHNYSPSSVKMGIWPASRFSGERNKGLDSNNLGVCPAS